MTVETTQKLKTKSYLISFPYNSKKFDLDPLAIGHAYEAIILDNMYRGLISYDNNGNLVPNLADEFYWKVDHFVFAFKGTRKTSRGRSITPEDVEATFKRMLIKAQNVHGKLNDYLCENRKIENLNDECSGIQVEGNMLKLFPKKGISREILLNLIAGIDFLILPKDAFSHVAPYEILDYTNTTGAYSLSNQPNEFLSFTINNFDDAYKLSAIRKWNLVKSKITESAKDIGKKFDLITTASFISDLGKFEDKLEVFKTKKISIEKIVFTKKGQSDFSVNERAFAAKYLRKVLHNRVEKNQTENYQIFPPGAVGSLGKDFETTYKEKFDQATPPHKKLKIGIPLSVFESFRILNEDKESPVCFLPFNTLKIHQNSEEVDGAYIVTDASIQEDIAFLEYSFSFGFFGYDEDFGKSWMKKVISSDRIDRGELMQDLHKQILLDFRVAPMYSSSYVAAGIDALDLSELPVDSASTHIWKAQLR